MVLDKIKEVVIEQLGVSDSEITLNTTFEDLGADSLDLFQIIMNLEEMFELEISTEDAENLRTVQDAVKYIEEKTKIEK